MKYQIVDRHQTRNNIFPLFGKPDHADPQYRFEVQKKFLGLFWIPTGDWFSKKESASDRIVELKQDTIINRFKSLFVINA